MNYARAIVWFVLSLIASCGNDAIMKYVGTNISPWQVAFFRCLFGTVTLLPVMLYYGKASFKTQRPLLHVVRGGLLSAAIGLWSHGIQAEPITIATIMSFTVPIFTLMLAPILLKERVTRAMWLVTWVGFAGIVLVLQPEDWSFHTSSLLFVLATILFAILDIINKKYVTQEPMLCMLFYSTLIATVVMAFPALCVGALPTTRHTLGWLLALGIGSNAILYFLLKAFALANASSLAPFRYLELLISMGVGYVFFQELPSIRSYLGAAVIAPCALFLVYHQGRKTK